MAKERVAKWDNIKFVLITLVVLGHSITLLGDDRTLLNRLFFWIYLYHMPAFMFLSGMFAKRTVAEKRHKKIFGFLYIYIFMCLFRFFVRSVQLHSFRSLSWLDEEGVPWYALVVFISYYVTIGLSTWKRSIATVLVVLIGATAGYNTNLGSGFAAMRLLTLYPFFWFGYCIQPEQVLKLSEKKWSKATAILILIASCLICLKFRMPVTASFLKGKVGFEKMNLVNQGFFYRLAYYAISMVLVTCVLVLVPNKKLPVITAMGGNSIQVYAMHYPLLGFLAAVSPLKKLIHGMSLLYAGPVLFAVTMVFVLILSLKFFTPLFTMIMNPYKVENGTKE